MKNVYFRPTIGQNEKKIDYDHKTFSSRKKKTFDAFFVSSIMNNEREKL